MPPANVLDAMHDTLRGLNTVCQEAKCPNIGECYRRGIAAIMICGDTCTRNCGFCGVKNGRPKPLDPYEPMRVAESVKKLGLKFVVITAVARDDIPDGGAEHFALTVKAIREIHPHCGIEVLIPDFRGNRAGLRTVLDSNPNVLNHNLETVRRLTQRVRAAAKYDRSLELLMRAKEIRPDGTTKSGIMVGLGEELEEIEETMRDLREVGCDMLTIGQYLSPSDRHLPVIRYVHPDEFDHFRELGLGLGFRNVASGVFVRSSYFAEEQALGEG